MWKIISRGIRGQFGKEALSNRTPNDQTGAAATQDNKFQRPCPFKLIPCLLEKFQNYSLPSTPENTKEDQGTNSDHQSSTSGSFGNQNIGSLQPCAILAVGWSGVLVLGWTILQPWYRHTQTRKPAAQHDLRPDAVNRYTGLYKLLPLPALSQPVNNHILPQHSSKFYLHTDASASSVDQLPVLPSQASETQTAPRELAPEEAFDQAAEEVKRIHERVIGEAENRRGVACMSVSQNTEAIEHFRIASSFRNAPAAFNLGQCYELGIGTEQDFVQAAHWYQKATDMGHPTAMYNLGVFYAHGWGGLDADSKQARKLFTTAAALGQPEAQAALDLKNLQKQGNEMNAQDRCKNEVVKERSDTYSILDFLNLSKLNINVLQPKESFEKVDESFARLRRSSLSSSPSTPSSLSSSSLSSSSTNDPLPFFHPKISSIEESSEDYSDASSSEDEFEMTANLAYMNGNSATLYRLAICYEHSPAAEQNPELILQLYQMAADHGHEKARHHLNILEQQHQLGTLPDYLRKKRQKLKSTQISECNFQK